MTTSHFSIGIDLGTTNSTIAQFSDGVFRAIPIDGMPIVPSVVAHDGKNFLIGRAALNHGRIRPSEAVFSVKRRMGDAVWRYSLGGEELAPERISSEILGYLKRKAEEVLEAEVKDVVVTVPAYFNDAQRRATIVAGEMAGLTVLRIVNEPTAAALAYDVVTMAHTQAEPAAGKWLVYDLGGGTFDVSVLQTSKGYKEVLASTGNCWLGGDDFDRKLVDRMVDRIKEVHGRNLSDDVIGMARLRHIAEQTKVRLSTEVEVHVHESLECACDPIEIDMVLTRPIFESLIGGLLRSTISKVRQAMEEANVDSRDISRLLLVGGSTRIPLVRHLLRELFEIAPDNFVDPDLSVALGASVQSALATGASFSNIVVDVAPHTIGVAALGEKDDFDYIGERSAKKEETGTDSDGLDHIRSRHPKTFCPIIHRNSKLPARFVQEFYTMYDKQDAVEVAVYQGESRCTAENAFIGAFIAQLDPCPTHSPVRVCFEYDLNGVIRMTIEQPGKRVAAAAMHVMDIKQSARLNSTTDVLERGAAIVADSEDDKWEEGETKGVPPGNVLNLIVKRVEEELVLTSDADEVVRIGGLLKKYREALGQGDDDVADVLEDELYEWLESK